jgi:adenine phosphoribosyltransferase
MKNQERKMQLESFIKDVPDFPKAGVIFKDIGPLLQDRFSETIEELGALIDWSQIDLIAGIESRGFILGCGLAAKFNKGFIPIRKKGKLPPPIISYEYELEYGQDVLEIKKMEERKRILVVDDVLATGGTLEAACNLCDQAGLDIQDLLVLIDLKFLNNFSWEGKSAKSLFTY